ncbi:MAG: hypothetical protein HZA16_07325 [Nitrospirae bacterium]|nr:hypothetical protein [Nitrospirota bacterium]
MALKLIQSNLPVSQIDIFDGLDIDLSFSLNVVEMILALEEAAEKTQYEWVLFETKRKLEHAQELLKMLWNEKGKENTLGGEQTHLSQP